MIDRTVKIALPSVHMAGSDAHHRAHLEIGSHGLSLFLAPDAAYPVLDVNGTADELSVVVAELQAALAARASDDPPADLAQLPLALAAHAGAPRS